MFDFLSNLQRDLHPIIVHFPIALLVLSFMLSLFWQRNERLSAASWPLLVVGGYATMTLKRQPTNLGELVEEVAESFQARAQQRGVTLTHAGAEVTATVDQTRLIQVLGNLLDNALRVTPAGAAVQLSVQACESGACLEVSDTGPGIPEADLPHIFERFVQGKDTKGSSGLGLAIVKALVKLHGGKVRVMNRTDVDGGALFQVRIPLQTSGVDALRKSHPVIKVGAPVYRADRGLATRSLCGCSGRVPHKQERANIDS